MAEDESNKKKEESITEKITGSVNDLRKSEKVEDLFQFAKGNTRDTISYIVLFLGIILLMFRPMWGGLMIGVVGGIYFAKEIVNWFQNLNQYVEERGLIRTIIIGGLALGLFLEAPYIFIGAAISIGVMQMVAGAE